jgi:ATP-dependent DNA helicase RecG
VKPLSLSSHIRDLGGVANMPVGNKKGGLSVHEALAQNLGLFTIEQLLHHYPRRYLDRSAMVSLRELRIGQEATIIASVRRVRQAYTRRRQPMVTVTVADGTGYLDLFWFNQSWPGQRMREGQEVMASGKLTLYRGRMRMANPTIDVLRGGGEETVHTGRIIPVHPATEGVSPGMIRRLVYEALKRVPEPPDPLPDTIRREERLIGWESAVHGIHFPGDWREKESSVERLKFDELFTLELGVAFRKQRLARQERGVVHHTDGELVQRFVASLPFELTTGQRRALDAIARSMGEPHPMNLLLQGDVGSGKTVVAVAACLMAVESGHQAAIMAPTEVLAGQHMRNVETMLEPLGGARFRARVPVRAGAGQPSLFGSGGEEPVRVDGGPTFALLTAAVTGRERAATLDAVRSGEVDIVVGTHALVQEGLAFRDLSLAVVDEQHRFGVHQRMALKGKGASPDVLIMTATPIPRTLALTYYGDLDVAVLDELPSGRRPVETMLAKTDDQRSDAYALVRREVAAGRQAFVVCAAIDEQNRIEVRAAEKEAERLATEVFPDLAVSLLHGRMRPVEKEARMEEFRSGQLDVLISTTVIEVGVDEPNATVMLVENAERFGLAQLHQLRGRIGRGAHRSYCVLFDESPPEGEEARERLEAMVRTTDGFELADEDLRLRGEGTLFDVKQAGMPDLQLAKLSEDLELVKRARARAFAMIETDPTLAKHPALRTELESRFADSIDWLFHT